MKKKNINVRMREERLEALSKDEIPGENISDKVRKAVDFYIKESGGDDPKEEIHDNDLREIIELLEKMLEKDKPYNLLKRIKEGEWK